MRRVTLHAVIGATSPEYVFHSIAQFERYPQYAPHLQSATVHETLPGPGRSSWELHFRSGLLRWTEQEDFDRTGLEITFAQLDGDFDEFAGWWRLEPDGADTRLHFEVDFDFGIPSLAGILDPIAERVIKETVAWVVVGMFDDVRLTEPLNLTPSA